MYKRIFIIQNQLKRLWRLVSANLLAFGNGLDKQTLQPHWTAEPGKLFHWAVPSGCLAFYPGHPAHGFFPGPRLAIPFSCFLSSQSKKKCPKPSSTPRPGVSGVWILPWGHTKATSICEVDGADVDPVRSDLGGSGYRAGLSQYCHPHGEHMAGVATSNTSLFSGQGLRSLCEPHMYPCWTVGTQKPIILLTTAPKHTHTIPKNVWAGRADVAEEVWRQSGKQFPLTWGGPSFCCIQKQSTSIIKDNLLTQSPPILNVIVIQNYLPCWPITLIVTCTK